jgi:cellulose biosynthesis protein BcsQ
MEASLITLTFFNNKGGVGKTSLAYHLAWMFAELGKSVVAVDLDPQANLTSAFLDEEELERLWDGSESTGTILTSIRPLLDRLGDLKPPRPVRIQAKVSLVPGDLGLSLFEDRLAETWGKCLDDNLSTAADAFRVTSAFYRVMKSAAADVRADLVLVDVGPNLGAINRAALVGTERVVVPLAADLFSLNGLRNLGPTLRQWRKGWIARRENADAVGVEDLDLPKGEMRPVGYVIMQPSVRERYPVKAYRRWVDRIPEVYREQMVEASKVAGTSSFELATLKNYRSLAPLAQDARKPMFLLRPSDGAIGGHVGAVRDCYADFEQLARRIAAACGLVM